MMFADIDVPLKALVDAVPGWISLIFLLALLLTVYNQGRKAFGRRPPINEELASMDKKLRGEIFHARNAVRKELLERMERAEAIIEDIRLDRERKWAALTGEYQEVKSSLDYLRGRIDALLKKLER